MQETIEEVGDLLRRQINELEGEEGRVVECMNRLERHLRRGIWLRGRSVLVAVLYSVGKG